MCEAILARCYDCSADIWEAATDLLRHPVGSETFAPFIYSLFDHMVVFLSECVLHRSVLGRGTRSCARLVPPPFPSSSLPSAPLVSTRSMLSRPSLGRQRWRRAAQQRVDSDVPWAGSVYARRHGARGGTREERRHAPKAFSATFYSGKKKSLSC